MRLYNPNRTNVTKKLSGLKHPNMPLSLIENSTSSNRKAKVINITTTNRDFTNRSYVRPISFFKLALNAK